MKTPPPSAYFSCLVAVVTVVHVASAAAAAEPSVSRLWSDYFANETRHIADQCLADVRSREDWERLAPGYRRQLREMLGLEPWPDRTPLQAVVTGGVDREDFRVENVQFQALPGLYVTGNLYLPKQVPARLPAVLYVSGHGPVKKNGISYGNKVTYQHHGAWFARHGYVCLIIDTIQLGEIEGLHHGTYREGMWWWNSRGYTPAGVEAWNSVRAIDYLQARPEVDPERIGMTGRSGGGAYSWWTAAIDERVRAVAPIAGITDLHNHVIDGTVEGHCDCMFMVNTFRWDYAQVAALVAPRPLLIGNTDRDSIFPLDGVVRVHRQVAQVYDLLNASTNLALLITEGPHKDTQDLQVPVLRWFNRFLKGEDPLISIAAEKFLQPEPLKVFSTLPADEIVTTIHERFVPVAGPPVVPDNPADWERTKQQWREQLEASTFNGWPEGEAPLELSERFSERPGGVRVRVLELEAQPGLSLPVLTIEPRGRSREIELRVLGHADWLMALRSLETRFNLTGLPKGATNLNEGLATSANALIPEELDHPLVLFAPRGAGATAPDLNARGFIQFRRRFMMLGQTLDGMRVWDIRRAIQALGEEFNLERTPLTVRANGSMAVNTLLAAFFETGLNKLELTAMPATFRDGPDYLNVLKTLDLPALLAGVSVGGSAAAVEVELSASPADVRAFATAVEARLQRSVAVPGHSKVQ